MLAEATTKRQRRCCRLRINGGVEGFDVDREYATLKQEVEDGRQLAVLAKGISFIDLFRGTNLVSSPRDELGRASRFTFYSL